jgi:hypothetical protein
MLAFVVPDLLFSLALVLISARLFPLEMRIEAGHSA